MVRELAQRRTYDLYLLLDVDVPWVADVTRYLPEDRSGFFNRCRAELEARGRRYVRITGSWEERFAQACAAVEAVLCGAGEP